MSPELRSTLLKAAAPLFGIVALLVVTRLRGLSWSGDVGIVRPGLRRAALWLGFWVVWIALCEAVIRWLGLPNAEPWKPYPPVILALRVLAIGVLGPICEELLFRGVLYGRLAATRLGPSGAIVLLAFGWAVVHTQYGWSTMTLIFLDGLVLGAARRHSGSVLVPTAMHILGNLISIGQSLGLW